jgi:hypothetical protein
LYENITAKDYLEFERLVGFGRVRTRAYHLGSKTDAVEGV